MKALPETFIQEMHSLFGQFGRGAEWPEFLASFSRQPDGGLRANTLKIGVSELRELLADGLGVRAEQLAPVSWSDDGFYVPAGSQPGKLVYHAAGLYYIQEPSAMLPAMVLGARPGERIMDLCAAPGGKTCRIAADLRGEGLLWANEISADRARALLHNVELTGCTNSLITQETPERLAAKLPEFFDAILVDAPCSGSGMFRRDPAAMDSWQAYGSLPCAEMQRAILQSAWAMLRPGGRLVYSTCTFSLMEDEAMIGWFLDEHPDSLILPIRKAPGVSDGLPLRPGMTGTARIWPHLAAGDGHFCALLQKKSCAQPVLAPAKPPRVAEAVPVTPAWQAFLDFCRLNLSASGLARVLDCCVPARMRHDHDCLHLLPAGVAAPTNLKNVKTGLFLGQLRTLRNGRQIYEPSPAFLFSLNAEDLRDPAVGAPHSELIRRYLNGETVAWNPAIPVEPGRTLAIMLETGAAGSWPLGWAKSMPGGQLKNLYPQAWRRNI